MVIYLITNLVNGKYYVGKTERSKAEARWCEHADDSVKHPERAPLLYRAFRKYGLVNFAFEILGEANSAEQLNTLEQLWIAVLHSADAAFGYNLTLGGTGGKPNAATLEKLRVPKTDEHKKNLSASRKGKSLLVTQMSTPAARSKAWETRRANASLINGFSATTRDAMSKAATERVSENPEHLIKARAARRPQVRGPLGTFIPRAPEKEALNG